MLALFVHNLDALGVLIINHRLSIKYQNLKSFLKS